MPLKTLVKVGSLTNLSDARYCAGMGVEMIGFQVIPGLPSFIAPDKFQEIRGWISGPAIVAEIYGIADKALITNIMEKYKPDYFELSAGDLKVTGKLPIPAILALTAGETAPMTDTSLKYILTSEPLAARKDIKSLIEVNTDVEANEAIKNVDVAGIATKGSTELRPGYKNYDELASILEALEED